MELVHHINNHCATSFPVFVISSTSYLAFAASSFLGLVTPIVKPPPTMYIYVGKLNWLYYAYNECITIVFPAGFALKDPVCAYWQWTVSGSGEEKANNSQEAFIDSVTNTNSDYRVRFSFAYYTFEGTISADLNSLSLTMSDPLDHTGPVSLSLQFGNSGRVPSTSVFTGKLDYLSYSKNEMLTFIIPGEMAKGEPVVLSYQWTVDGRGNAKTNHTVVTTMTACDAEPNGYVSAKFEDGFYLFDFIVRKGNDDLVLSMTDPAGEIDKNSPYRLHQTDFRDLRKKKVRLLHESLLFLLTTHYRP